MILTTHYNNEFAGRVRKSSRAFQSQTWARFVHRQCCAFFMYV